MLGQAHGRGQKAAKNLPVSQAGWRPRPPVVIKAIKIERAETRPAQDGREGPWQRQEGATVLPAAGRPEASVPICVLRARVPQRHCRCQLRATELPAFQHGVKV